MSEAAPKKRMTKAEREQAQRERCEKLHAFDAQVGESHGIFCGVDEAGRGPLCGPVCCAAVILDPERPIEGVDDSKKLTEKKREQLYDIIMENAVAASVVMIGPEEIDRVNIRNATMEGMVQAVQGLSFEPAFALIDGDFVPNGLLTPAASCVKGDATSASIAAASILAKVTRDRYMEQLDREFPQYQLAKHKGYGTKLHYEMIEKYGLQPFYRRSFLKKLGY